MGSFNTTCCVSRQTIATGDRCRVVAITQSSTFQPVALSKGTETSQQLGIANANCYPDCFWKPKTGFLPATYDDYGQVKLALDETARTDVLTFLADLYQEAQVSGGGMAAAHTGGFDFPLFVESQLPGLNALFKPRGPFSGAIVVEDDRLDVQIRTAWAYVWNAAQQFRLFTRGHSGYVRPLQFAILHESTYQALISQVAQQTDWHGNSCAPDAVVRRALADAQEHVAELLSKEEDKSPRIQAFWLADSLDGKLLSLDRGGCLPRIVTGKKLRRLCDEFLSQGLAVDAFVAKVALAMSDRYAVAGMDRVNAQFSPFVAAGQDDRNSQGQAFLALVEQVCREVTAPRLQERE